MTDPTARLNAALEGRYAIERELGEGGMANVYLADDLKHERKVALKVLKPELAAVVGAERFLTEIKTTANLQHPHILPLFDSGEADSFLFYVMPYVEGETLRERIDRDKQLPIGEAVAITTAVASALQHAHDRGVIHRDIKPANILLQGGQPVVADFGIALAVGAAGGSRLTETGLSVGTPFYMSPEQATGDQGVGPASDTYALGCVLYELLVGEPPYIGNTAQAVLGKIIQGASVSATQIRKSIPPNVDAALRKALEKLPADRFTGAQAFASALADPSFRHGEGAAAGSLVGGGAWKRAAAAFAALSLGLAAVAAWSFSRPESRPVVRFRPAFEEGQALETGSGVNVALSPDGSWLVYAGPSETATQLWRRPLNQLAPVPIPGTESARNPVISPEGSSIAFTAGGSLKTISLLGGPATTLVREGVPDGGGGIDWSDDGWIYFVDDPGTVRRVLASGGDPETVAVPEDDTQFAWVDALPEGRGVLLTITRGTPDLSEIGVVGAAGGDVHVLFAGAMARYASSEHLVYAAADNSLLGVRFDLGRLETSGSPVALLQDVDVYNGSASQFALSETGTLVYMAGQTTTDAIPVWVDRTGAAREVEPGFRVSGLTTSAGVALSPSGGRLAVTRNDPDGPDVWVKELDDGPETKLTLAEATSHRPTWSPDGERVAFVSDRGEGLFAGWERRADGAGVAELLVEAVEPVYEVDLSSDGEWLIYRTGSAIGDIYAKRLGADSSAIPLIVSSDFIERHPALSPDGRWLAYTSNESGQFEVYVVPFPDVASGRVTVSTEGGAEPVWAHGGEELFYRDGNDQMVAVRITGEPFFAVEARTVLFPMDDFLPATPHQTYDVAPGDQRFLMLRPVQADDAADMIIVQNWLEEVKARVGGS